MNVRRGIPLALAAGVLFGLSAPLSKLLVADMDSDRAGRGPVPRCIRGPCPIGRLLGVTRGLHSESLQRPDVPYVLAMIAVGGGRGADTPDVRRSCGVGVHSIPAP